MSGISHWLKISIGPIWLQCLRSPHHGDKVLRLTQIDNIVGPTRFHPYSLDVIPVNLVLLYLASLKIPLLNLPMAFDHNENFIFAIVPMLAFGDSGFTYVDAHLSAIRSLYQLRKAASCIHIHLIIEDGSLTR